MAKYFYMLFIVVVCLNLYASAELVLGNLIGKKIAQRLKANIGLPGHDVIDDGGDN